MAELSAVLADSTTIRPLPFDPEAIEILWTVAQTARLPSPLLVRSGYRTPAINAAVRGAGDSQHLRAAALDVEVGGRVAEIAAVALRLGRGGVGSYAHRGFVHLDSGPVRRWDGGGLLAAGSGGPRRIDTRMDMLSRIAGEWQRTRTR
jgi:uncharacterized protein YcbK (DUF882 family)